MGRPAIHLVRNPVKEVTGCGEFNRRIARSFVQLVYHINHGACRTAPMISDTRNLQESVFVGSDLFELILQIRSDISIIAIIGVTQYFGRITANPPE